MLACCADSFRTYNGHAVVCALAQGNHQGDTTLVYCLPLETDGNVEGDVRVVGKPFRLRNRLDRYIWPNYQLRHEKITRGTMISFKRERCTKCIDYSCCYYSGNTGRKLDMNPVLSQLKFANQGVNGVVYRGIQDAFLNTKMCVKKIYVYQNDVDDEDDGDEDGIALIGIKTAKIVDGRVFIKTLQEEPECILKNNCRITKQNTIEEVSLPVAAPSSDKDVGSVVLVKRDKPNQLPVVCEGILLNSANQNMTQNPKVKLPTYEMKSRPSGKCIMINNEQFHEEAYNRDGAKHDEKGLKDLFEELGFVVDIRKNLTRDEINKTSKDVAAEDHSNFDAFVFIIMSHGGSRDAVCGVDDRPAYVEDVMSEFKAMKCPTLRNKPKLFFIQCCRGSSTEFISPPDRHCDSLVPRLNHDSTLARSVCPQEADFLLAFAAAPGYYSYRYPAGSTFIQVLVDVIREYHQNSHLIEMLTEVTRQVVERGTKADDKVPRVQVPAYSNTLRAKLYL